MAACLVVLAAPADGRAQEAGETIKDCAVCPELVVVPPGRFTMGDLSGDGLANERPAHEVTIPHRLAVGTTEVTFAQWDACVAEGGCSHSPDDKNWGRGERPVSEVNWPDTQEYLAWLSARTGHAYRLPTEAEWEYVARAGTTTKYPWGDELGEGNAVCLSCGVGLASQVPVAQTPPNSFGLYDTSGGVQEWVQDCWNSNYQGAPADGRAWLDGDCERRVARGGTWYDAARFIRSASRVGHVAEARDEIRGFRVVRELD